MLHTLLQVSERSLALAALAAVCLMCVKSASLKHAAWTIVTAGMLLQILLGPVLPPLPIPVFRPIELVSVRMSVATPTPLPPASLQPVHFPIVAAIYFAGVLFFTARLVRACFFTRRLVHRSEPIAPGRYQSREIAVPLTAGSKILLPLDWSDWDPEKLRAVLAHEEAHVRRRDSMVALLARINRCVFWFHPLAWWLERELTQFAEQACDDAALLSIQDRQQYARTLLDMARAVHASNGRFITAAMAKEANVETRINRILDESRRIPKALGKVAWTMLLACAAPLIYFGAVVQLSLAQTIMQIPVPAAPEPPVLVAQAAPTPTPAPPAPPVPQPETAPAPVPQAEPENSFSHLPKPPDSVYRARNEERLKAELSQAPQLPKISIAFSPLRSGVITIPLGDPVEHQVNAQIFAAGRGFVMSAEHVITGSSWEMPISLKPGMYELIVSIKTGDNITGSRLGFNVE